MFEPAVLAVMLVCGPFWLAFLALAVLEIVVNEVPKLKLPTIGKKGAK